MPVPRQKKKARKPAARGKKAKSADRPVAARAIGEMADAAGKVTSFVIGMFGLPRRKVVTAKKTRKKRTSKEAPVPETSATLAEESD